MAKQGKKTAAPKLRFPEFRADAWNSVSGDEIFDQINNREPSSNLPMLAITQEHGAIPRDLIDYHVSVTDRSIESYKVVEPGDFIISLRSFEGGIEFSKYHGVCSPAYVVLRQKASHSSQYFKQFLKSSRFIQQMTRNIEGLRDGKMVSFKQFSELLLPIPAVEEQHKIADCLTSLDEMIAAQDRKVKALKAHQRGLIQQLFPREGETRPRLRFPEFRDASEWEIKPLSGIAENLDSKRVPITESVRTKGEVPYYGASGIVDYVEGHIFDEDLLCISEDGANLVARTHPIAFPISGKTWVNNHAHVLRFDSSATQKMVQDYLNSIDLRDFITGVAQPKLNRTMLDSIAVPLPEADEQNRIADCLSSLDAKIMAEYHQLAAFSAHKQGLMQQLFPAPESDT